MTNTIKIDDQATLALIRQFKADRARRLEEIEAYQAEVQAKIEQMKAASNEAHTAFWKKLEEIAPATIDGDWKMDADYIDEGLVFLTRREEKAEEDNDEGMPAPLRRLLGALEAAGVKVGAAKIEVAVKRDE